MKLAATVLALSVFASPALAEERKSENAAFALSAGGTLVSAGLVAYAAHRAPDDAADTYLAAGAVALAVTPTLGHWYAGDYVTLGLGARVVGGAAIYLGHRMASCGGDCSSDGGTALMVFGAGAVIAGALWDVATASRAAQTWNARHYLALTPTVTPGGAGLSFGGSF